MQEMYQMDTVANMISKSYIIEKDAFINEISSRLLQFQITAINGRNKNENKDNGFLCNHIYGNDVRFMRKKRSHKRCK